MADLRTVHKQSKSKAEFARGYLSHIAELCDQLDSEVIGRIIGAMEDAGRGGKAIYFIGNGGSASTASHFANDIGFGTRAPGHPSFKAISLVDNVAVMTALANDEGYDNVFKSQLENILQPGDLLLALSVSGNSPNVLSAVRYANEKGALTIGITGFEGGALRSLAQINLHIPTPKGEYGPVEDIFAIMDHLIASYLRLQRRGDL